MGTLKKLAKIASILARRLERKTDIVPWILDHTEDELTYRAFSETHFGVVSAIASLLVFEGLRLFVSMIIILV